MPPVVERPVALVRDEYADRIGWLLLELQRPDIRAVVGEEAAERLGAHYRLKLQPAASALPAPEEVAATEPSAPIEALAPEVGEILAQPPSILAAAAAAPSPSQPILPPRQSLLPPLPPMPGGPALPRPKPWESWDSANVLLYLGAFLVVAAGLVYSSRNWSDLPGWQKVGMLGLTTLGFTAVGLFLLRSERVRAAAETFVGIGALLVPMDVLAAYNFVIRKDDGDLLGPWATLAIGAILVAGLYGCFAYRPGGLVYRYGAVGAAVLAIAAVPPAFGAHWSWGAALVALASGAVPDASHRLRGRLRRFARPAVDVGLVALPVAVLATVAAAVVDGRRWAVPVALIGAAVTSWRLAGRRASEPLATGWSGVVAAALAATLWAAQLDLAAGIPVAVALAAAWLALGERGPELLRRPAVRDVLHAEACLALLLAPVLGVADERWWAVTLALVAATVGVAAIAWLRGLPLLAGVAAAIGSGAYLSLAKVVPERVLDLPEPALLAPGAVLVALAASGVGGRSGERWSLPIWIVAGVDAIGISILALAQALAPDSGVRDGLVLAAVCLAFAAVAVGAVVGLRRPEPVFAAAVWLEAGLAALLLVLPAELDRTLPGLVVVNVALLGLAAAIPLGRVLTADPAMTRDGLLGWFGLGVGVPLVGMLGVSATYVLDGERPSSIALHAETAWWWPYLVVFAALVPAARWLGRWIPGPGMPVLSAAGIFGAETLGLRMAAAPIRIDFPYWLVIATTCGLATIGLAWRYPGDRGAERPRLTRSFVGWESAAAGLIAGPLLLIMLLGTLIHTLDVDKPVTVAGNGETGWWLTFLGFFLAVFGVLAWIGPRLLPARLATAATVAGVAGAALGWRSLYGLAPLDGYDWLPILTLLGAIGVAAGLHLRARGWTWSGAGTDAITTRVGLETAAVFGVVAGLALAASALLTLAVIIDVEGDLGVPFADRPGWWWRFLLLHVTVAVATWVTGRRTEQPAAAPVAVGFGVLSAGLALRMATDDLVLWTYVGVVVAGVAYGLTQVFDWSSDFDRVQEETLRIVAIAVGLAAIGGNVILAIDGRTNHLAQAVLYLAVAGGIFVASLLEERPQIAYGAASALAVGAGFGVAATGAAAVNVGYVYAALAWAIFGTSFVLSREGRWQGQSLVWERSAFGLAALPVVLGLTADGAFDPQAGAYQRLVLALAAFAGLLGVGAVLRRRLWQGYVAATAGLGAVLMQISVASPPNIQAYTVPIGLYLLGLAWTRRRVPREFDLLAAAGAALILAPPFIQSFGAGGFGWALLCGAEGLVFVAIGLILGRRAPLAAGIGAVTLVVLRQILDYVHSLPSWAIMALVGLLLLVLGTLSLLARDSFLRRIEETRERWFELE